VNPVIVTGTDTGVGKTVFAAALTLALQAAYWKPIQSGLEEETDAQAVRRLTGLPAGHFVPEAYRLRQALSPHRSAELDGVAIDPEKLAFPSVDGPLVVEAAGGLMVPITRSLLFIDQIARWCAEVADLNVVLCARTTLGTINHTLLSLEALRARSIDLLGVAFIGEENADSERTIAQMGRVRCLGRLPMLERLDRAGLCAAFAQNFNIEDFRRAA